MNSWLLFLFLRKHSRSPDTSEMNPVTSCCVSAKKQLPPQQAIWCLYVLKGFNHQYDSYFPAARRVSSACLSKAEGSTCYRRQLKQANTRWNGWKAGVGFVLLHAEEVSGVNRNLAWIATRLSYTHTFPSTHTHTLTHTSGLMGSLDAAQCIHTRQDFTWGHKRHTVSVQLQHQTTTF